MASDFLKNAAQRQAEKMDKEYGPDATAAATGDSSSTGGQTTAARTQSRHSRRSRQAAPVPSCAPRPEGQRARGRRIRPDAYGGSNYKFNTQPASSFAKRWTNAGL